MLEILVSTILLALVITSLANIFVATKRLIFHVRARATAAEISKYYLDPLQMRVSAQNWGTTTASGNCLRMFTQVALDTTVWIDDTSATTYTPEYDVSNPQDGIIDIDDMDMNPNPPNPPTDMICRVPLRIHWDERTR